MSEWTLFPDGNIPPYARAAARARTEAQAVGRKLWRDLVGNGLVRWAPEMRVLLYANDLLLPNSPESPPMWVTRYVFSDPPPPSVYSFPDLEDTVTTALLLEQARELAQKPLLYLVPAMLHGPNWEKSEPPGHWWRVTCPSWELEGRHRAWFSLASVAVLDLMDRLGKED